MNSSPRPHQISGRSVLEAPVRLPCERERGEGVWRELVVPSPPDPGHLQLPPLDPLVLANLVLEVVPLLEAVDARLVVVPDQELKGK